MPTAILPALLRRHPDLLDLPQEEIDKLVEQESQRYDREIVAERGIPGENPEEALRAALPREELSTVGLGLEEGAPGAPEHLGAYTQEDVGPPVPEEQAQRWMEEREVYDAKYKLAGLIRESREYREELIDKQFGGLDPTLRNVEKLGKELAKVEMKTAEQQIKEIIGKEDPSEMTPRERLAMLNAKEQARREAMTTIRQQKQDDVATLQQAVSTFNEEQKAKMVSIERRRGEIQELHAAEAEAEAKVEAERVKAIGKSEVKPVDLKRLFDMGQKLEKQIREEGKASGNSLRLYNKLAKQLGQPEIVKKKEAIEPRDIPILSWFSPAFKGVGGEPAEYGPAEETEQIRRPMYESKYQVRDALRRGDITQEQALKLLGQF